MKNLSAVVWQTLREARASKAFLSFTIIMIIGLTLYGFVMFSAGFDLFLESAGEASQNEILNMFLFTILNFIYFFLIVMATFSSARVIPAALEKGQVELLLSKPVSRTQIIIGKFIGVIIFNFIIISFLILGTWIITSFRFSFWNANFLLSIPVILFIFAVLYSIILLFGVITKQSLAGMMIVYFIFLIVSPFLYAVKEGSIGFLNSSGIESLLITLYYILPKTAELGAYFHMILFSGDIDYQPFLTSFIFMALLTAISIFLFKRKDF
jgi:ABC-type transport system involved in multi-copper enzyme maturation permease subunit